MYDTSQLRPVQTGEASEIQPSPPTIPPPSGETHTSEVSPLSAHDALDHKPQLRAHLTHEVQFEGGQAVTKSGPATPATVSPTPESDTVNSLPAALQDVSQDVLTLLTEAMAACKEQNFQAALDVIDSAIAAHRKMLEEAKAQAKKQAPIEAAQRQATALKALQADIVQQQAAQQAADQRRVAP